MFSTRFAAAVLLSTLLAACTGTTTTQISSSAPQTPAAQKSPSAAASTPPTAAAPASSAPTQPPASATLAADGPPVLIPDQFGLGTQVAQVVKNTGSGWARLGTLTTVTLYDADGSVAETNDVMSAVPDLIPAGGHGYLLGSLDAKTIKSGQHVEVEIKSSAHDGPTATYPVTKQKIANGSITGLVTNDGTDAPVTFSLYAVFIDASGKPAGWAETSMLDFPVGATKPFQISVDESLAKLKYELVADPLVIF